MITKHVSLSLLIIGSLYAISCFAMAPWKVGVIKDRPPFSYIENKKFSGIAVDIL